MCQAMEATSMDLQCWREKKSEGQEDVAVVKNRIETEDDRSVQVAAVHGRQDMRMKRHSMGVSHEKKRIGRMVDLTDLDNVRHMGSQCHKCG